MTPAGNARHPLVTTGVITEVRCLIGHALLTSFSCSAPQRNMENTDKRLSEDELLRGKMVHLALPVRWSLIGPQGRGPVEIACTYDVHLQGARLLGGHGLHLGDRVMMERGRSKAICQVTWIADPDSSLRGQFSVRCLEGEVPWEEGGREMEERFHPASFDGLKRPAVREFGNRENNRRR